MNTVQSNIGNAGFTTSTPFNPLSINVSIGVVNFRSDTDHFGISQVEVLMNALGAYKRQVVGFVDQEEREAVLNGIADLEGDVKQAMCDHLSESAKLLYYQQQPPIPDPARRSSK